MKDSGWIEGKGEKRGLMIVNEFPSDECVKKHRVMPWKFEKEMGQMLDKAGWRGPIWATNMFKYQLNDKKQHTPDEWDMMKSLMEEEVERVEPDVILSVGPLSTRMFTENERYDMETMNGVAHQWRGIKVVPCISILSALYSTDLYSMVVEAVKKATKSDDDEMWKEPGGMEWRNTGIETVISHYVDGIAIDTETLKSGNTYMIQASTQEDEVCILYANDVYNVGRLKKFVEKNGVHTVMHNAMFDLGTLEQVGIRPSYIHDTMVMAFLLQTYPLGLKNLAYHIGKWVMDEYETVVGDLPDLSFVEEGKREKYAGDDPIATIRVFNHLRSRAKAEGYEKFWDVEQRDVGIMSMLMAMMKRGIKADVGRFKDMEAELWLKMQIMTEEMRELLGNPQFATGKKKEPWAEFNPGSDKQVAEILYKRLGLGRGKDIKKNKWGGSVDKNQLKKIEGEHPIVALLQEYGETDTILDSFATALPEKIGEDGRIHTSLQLVRVKHSGRISSSKPNLMAIPVRTEDGRRIRQCFVADDGYVLVGNDYSQVEMRLMAHLSQDPKMLDAYKNNKDIHSETAMAMFELPKLEMVDELKHRYPAKRTGFGIINNISAGGLKRELLDGGAGNWEEWECEELLNRWFSVYPGVKNFMLRTQAEARRWKKVYDMWGRMEYIPQVDSSQEYLKEKGLRIAMNQKIQSGAQGIIKEAMKNLREYWPEWVEKKWAYPILQIHDDLMWEIKEEKVEEIVPVIRHIMETPVKLSVPLKVDTKIGKNWMEMKKWKTT